MKGNQDGAASNLEMDLDAINMERGLVSNFARKMQQQPTEFLNHHSQGNNYPAASSVSSVAQHLANQQSSKAPNYLQTNDLK
jgi:hypothetical protein